MRDFFWKTTVKEIQLDDITLQVFLDLGGLAMAPVAVMQSAR